MVAQAVLTVTRERDSALQLNYAAVRLQVLCLSG